MNIENLKQSQRWVKSQLIECVNFWLEHGMDSENGGVYTCLDREGNIYSTDKSVWMQGRCAWTFAYLCKQYGKNEQWLQASKSCLDFMEAHCINREAENRMYFTVTSDGKPLRQRRYCFSEGFYAIANAEFYGLTGQEEYLARARRAYKLIYKLNNGLIADPTGLGSKSITSTRATRGLADPMIFLNIISVLRSVDKGNQGEYNKYAEECTNAVLNYHFKPELACTLESVSIDGKAELDYTAGRVVNPGHDIECSWFLMQHANLIKNKQIHCKAQEMFRFAIEKGWDNEYGGLLYFIDCLGKPTEAYEHDMKLWWPHTEILIASIMAYRDTGDDYYLNWFYKTLDYCKKYFVDDSFAEWYGYLRRDGKPTMPATKGSTFKGPFHMPRMLIMVDEIISEILKSVEK